MKRTLLFISVCLISFSAKNECGNKIPISCSLSQSQRWAGGIAGMWGVNYSFTFTSKYANKILSLDTIWIGEVCFPLNDSINIGVAISESEKGTNYSFTFSDNHSDFVDKNSLTEIKKENLITPPIPYNGKALLQYRFKGKKEYFIIKTMETLPPLNYP